LYVLDIDMRSIWWIGSRASITALHHDVKHNKSKKEF
jgi:hypothetical protein